VTVKSELISVTYTNMVNIIELNYKSLNQKKIEGPFSPPHVELTVSLKLQVCITTVILTLGRKNSFNYHLKIVCAKGL